MADIAPPRTTRRRAFLETSSVMWLGSGLACGLLDRDRGPDPEAAAAAARKDAEANDVTLLNAGIALEQGAINVYTAAAGLPFIAEDRVVLETAKRFMSHHAEHRDTLARLVETLGGTPFDPKAAKTPDIPAAVLDEAALVEDRKKATLGFARTLERRAADTYFQLIVQQLHTDVARRGAANILPVEAQHVAIYDMVLGATPVDAALFVDQS